MRSLEEILAYENADVLSRFTDLYAVTEEEAHDLFRETLKFLYLIPKGGAFIPDDMLILDEMWHNFALFTREYAAFCRDYFGAFLHHHPATLAEKEIDKAAFLADAEAYQAEGLKRLQDLMSMTFDHLGPETVSKWFQDYPERYSPERIRSLRK